MSEQGQPDQDGIIYHIADDGWRTEVRSRLDFRAHHWLSDLHRRQCSDYVSATGMAVEETKREIRDRVVHQASKILVNHPAESVRANPRAELLLMRIRELEAQVAQLQSMAPSRSTTRNISAAPSLPLGLRYCPQCSGRGCQEDRTTCPGCGGSGVKEI